MPVEAEERLLLRASEVGALLGLHVRSVWRLAAIGELPAPIRVGKSTRWVRSQIEQFIAAKAEAAEREREHRKKTRHPRAHCL